MGDARVLRKSMSIVLFDPPGCVFIRIHKTGSTSVIKGLFGGIGAAKEVSRDGLWSPAFEGRPCFTFVRNPFERLASVFLMFRDYPVSDGADRSFQKSLSLDHVMDVIEDETIPVGERSYLSKLRMHALPLTHPLVHIHRATFVGRMERFEDDYRALGEWIGLSVNQVPTERLRAEALDYRGFYSPQTRRRAQVLLARDADTFNYDF